MADVEEKSPMTWQDYWAIICRRRRLLFLVSFGLWLLIFAMSWLLPTVYTSETVILLERQIVPEQYVAANVVEDPTVQLQKMTQKVLSRPRLAKIIEDYHLYPKELRKSRDLAVVAMRRDIAISFVAPGTLPGSTGGTTTNATYLALLKSKDATAFAIDYSAPTAKLAQQINSQLTSLFIEENL